MAVANQPGLAGSLLVGLSAAKTLALALDIPLVAINHLQAHIYACRMTDGPEVFPCVGLVVSGGHTSLYRCSGAAGFHTAGGHDRRRRGRGVRQSREHARLALSRRTVDRARRRARQRAGLRLPAVAFARGAARLQLQRPEDGGALSDIGTGDAGRSGVALPQTVADLAASFQQAVIDCLVGKSLQAVRRLDWKRCASRAAWPPTAHFAERLEDACQSGRRPIARSAAALCTDNAVMGAIAVERLKAGLVETLDLDAYPGLVRGESAA